MRIFETDTGTKTHIVREFGWNSWDNPVSLCGTMPNADSLRVVGLGNDPRWVPDEVTCRRCRRARISHGAV